MIIKQRSYMMESEDCTLEMIEDLDAKKVFIRSLPEETVNRIIEQYRYTKECIITYGSEHKVALTQLRNLAEDLILVRHFTSAASILDRTCLGCKRCYGSKHVNVALVLSRQGYALSLDSKFREATECYDKSLRLLEQLYNFQVDYSTQLSRYTEHSNNSISTTSSCLIVVPTLAVPVLDGLGYTLSALERYRESEFCFRLLLHYYTSAEPSVDRTQEPFLPSEPSTPLGQQHPEALKAVNKLAKALQAQGKFREADQLCGDSLKHSVQTLGANHPTTQTSVVTMAQLKHAQGCIQEAEEMYRRSLACNEEVLGADHTETLGNVMLIAGLRAEQRDYRGAEILFNRALTGFEMTVGLHNSSTIDAVHCVGAMLLKQQKPTDALLQLNRALEERRAYYGPSHPATLSTLFCIGKAYHLESLWKHRSDSAELVQRCLGELRFCLTGFDAVAGVNSVQSIECCEYLCMVLLQRNEFSAALPYSRRIYMYYHTSGGDGCDKNNVKDTHGKAQKAPDRGGIKLEYGPLHKRTAEAAYQLATLLENGTNITGSSDAARHHEAAELFLQAHEGFRQQYERLSQDDAYCTRNAHRIHSGYNYDSAEGKVPDEEVSVEELRELVEDALEQHNHALRRSMY